jgi:hypothetical protein
MKPQKIDEIMQQWIAEVDALPPTPPHNPNRLSCRQNKPRHDLEVKYQQMISDILNAEQ